MDQKYCILCHTRAGVCIVGIGVVAPPADIRSDMKKVLTQAIFFLSIFGVIWVVLNISVRKKEDHLLRFKPSQVESVSIHYGNSTLQLTLTPAEDGAVWVIKEGDRSALADDTAARTFLAFLARVTVIERFKSADFPDADSQTRVGLGSLAKVAITLKSGKTLTLLLGRQTPSGTELYASSLADPETIATIPNSFEKRILPDFMGLRSRQVFSLRGIAKVELVYQDKPIILESKDGAWQSPTLTPDQTTGLVKAIRAVLYTNYFPMVAEGELGGYGLTLPDLTVMLTSTDGSTTTYDLSHYSGRYYLRLHANGPQDVLILPDRSGLGLLNELQKLVVHRSAS